MSSWNYRVIRKPTPDTDSVVYQIHEVYYREDGTIEGWTAEPVTPLGESVEELREDIRYFLQAFRRPVLEEKTASGTELLLEDSHDTLINEGHYFEFMDRAAVALHGEIGDRPRFFREEKPISIDSNSPNQRMRRRATRAADAERRSHGQKSSACQCGKTVNS